MKGLYIHIPFCHKICSYCDFVKRVPKSKEVVDEYLSKLVEEISTYQDEFNSINTIYIGGGTPSMLDIDQLTFLFESLKSIKPIEFTIEINPETYTKEKGQLFKKYGVNRFSIGVETFDENLLNVLNRSHTNYDVYKVVESLKELNLDNINIDMMYAIPGQSMDSLINDLRNTIELNPKHISYYSLILEENTYFYHQYKYNKLELIDNDIESEMFETVMNELSKTGYHHYEISNFAKTGYESKHNLIYWTMDEYIGCGLGAAGFINTYRTANTRVLSKYLNKTEESCILQTKEELIQDEMIFGLRKLSGVNLDIINAKYNIDILTMFPKIIEMEKEGLVKISNNNLSLTRKGIFLGNQVFMVFI